MDISWEEAISRIADRLAAIASEQGDLRSVLNAHYTGTIALIAFLFPMRFFNRLGATEVDPDTICNKAGHVALEYLYGTSTDGFDPRTASSASAIVVWGANPSASAPHQHEDWLREAPGDVIVVDPLRTETAEDADLHLQPFPGSDAALAFSLIHVLNRDGLIDHTFLENHTTGWSAIESTVDGCTPSWGESVTGVPSALIEKAAHLYGAGPSLLWIGQGLQRQPQGGNIVRAIGMLPAVTGNLGRPGAGFLYINGPETRGVDASYLIAPNLRRDEEATISHMDLAATLENPDQARALFCWNMNVAGSGPNQRRLMRALSRDDLFTVVVDLYPTDTTDFADVVLPAASFLEHDDLVFAYFNHAISAQVKVVDPPGLALPNSEIFRRLAVAMNYDDPELYETDDDIIENILASSRVDMDFTALAEIGTVFGTERPRVQFEELRFQTPSGRIELASDFAEKNGDPRVPTPAVDPRPPAGKLRLLSPASEWMLNTEYSNDKKIAKRSGPAAVTLNVADASSRGLMDGDWARVISSAGQLELRVRVSDVVPSGVALIPKGRWPKLERTGSNVNVLNPGLKADLGVSSAVHGTEVGVERIEKAGLAMRGSPSVVSRASDLV